MKPEEIQQFCIQGTDAYLRHLEANGGGEEVVEVRRERRADEAEDVLVEERHRDVAAHVGDGRDEARAPECPVGHRGALRDHARFSQRRSANISASAAMVSEGFGPVATGMMLASTT